MEGNDRQYQDDQSAQDKREQADKDMPTPLSHGGDGEAPGPGRE